MDKLSIIAKPDNFFEFVSKIEDLTKISDVIKIKMDSDNILLYSMMGSDNIILAFKCYNLKTQDFFDFKKEIDFTLNIIIPSSKKFVKNLAFIKTSEKIQIDISHKFTDDDSISDTRFLQINNGKFKLQMQAGENSEIRDLNRSMLSQRLNLKNKKWSFSISNKDFIDIKKLSTINSDDSRRILHLNVDDGKVKLSELSLWELEVDEVGEPSKHLMFNKSLLGCINDSGNNIELHVFETFILINDEISQLMISFEQDFSDHD